MTPTPPCFSGSILLRHLSPEKKRARENVDAARRREVPVGELRARFMGGKLLRRTTPELAAPSPIASQGSHVSGNLSPVDEERDNSDEEEGGGRGLVTMGEDRRLSPVATCREHSTSAWLHFPHVELVVLFFAFEGAVASFASAMRHSECPEIFYTALAALVSGTVPCINQKSCPRVPVKLVMGRLYCHVLGFTARSWRVGQLVHGCLYPHAWS